MKSSVSIDESWRNLLSEEFKKPYFNDIGTFVKGEYKRKIVYPKGRDVFNAFNSTPVNKVKVVILGQDPYHGPNQAHGLCFSVLEGVPVPPSLKNIYKEINLDLGIGISKSGFLQKWANQGVFLLNNVLTVEKGKANSHRNCGCEIFTAKVIQRLSEARNGLVFLLWGKSAQEKEKIIDSNRHLILKAPHPSPLSAHTGFLGCKHFSKTNTYLQENKKNPIDWRIA